MKRLSESFKPSLNMVIARKPSSMITIRFTTSGDIIMIVGFKGGQKRTQNSTPCIKPIAFAHPAWLI
ncbi:hypothetical protein QUF76_16560 [Desulfobacterales bacterium HSG16]|nr:hypothetical protein [Desulfobacterales bacterium HSG16]